MRRTGLTLISTMTLIAVAALAQTPKPSFQVVSVKVSPRSGFAPTTLQMTGNRFSSTGMPLRPLIMQVYNLRDFQIVGGPSWINTDQWDFEAVADNGVSLRLVDLEKPDRPTPGSLMVQSLIEDRFQLKFHRDTRELPVYELTVAKNGSKLKSPAGQAAATWKTGRGQIETQAQPFALFTYLLARQLDRTLIDKTNLTGLYDIKLQWNTELKLETEAASSSDRPSVSTALQEQLGLRLESAKGPVEVFVVDSVQKPSSN